MLETGNAPPALLRVFVICSSCFEYVSDFKIRASCFVMTAPNLIRIDSLSDPRVAAYGNLRDRTLRGERMFVAEGGLLVMRLLKSRFSADSLLAAESLATEFLPHVPAGVPIYVAAKSLLETIIGFHLHHGVLAAGRRLPEMSLEEMLG